MADAHPAPKETKIPDIGSEMVTTLLGRAGEVRALDEVLRRAIEGMGVAAVVEGEAGVGKTRLLEEFLHHAMAAGAVVRHGTAEELERSRPFGSLADAFSGVAAGSDAVDLLVAAANGSAPQHNNNVQFLVLETLLDHVEEIASTAPVVLALDDLQWADTSTLLTVQSLTRRFSSLPVALVVTVRPTPRDKELERLLETLYTVPAKHLRLRPLDDAAVMALISDVLDAEPGPNLRAQVRRAAGNPFYLHELLRTLLDADAIEVRDGVADSGGVPLPVTLGTTILRHLRYLEPDTLEVLQSAAVLGTSFASAELAAVSGRPVDRLLAPLQEAIQVGIVHDRPGGFVFRHDLVREALYERIPEGIRRELHTAAGRALGALGAPSTRVATQFALGAPRGDAEAISFLRRAAEETQTTAPDIALGFIRQAIDLAPPTHPRLDRMRTDEIRLLVASGEGAAAYELAQRLLARDHDPDLDGVLRFSAGQALFLLGRRPEAPEQLEQAAREASLDDAERALILSEAGLTRVLGLGDLIGAEKNVRHAEELGAATGDRFVEAMTLSVRALIEQFRGNAATAVRSATRAVDLAKGASDPRGAGFRSALRDPYLFHGIALLDADRLDEAEAAFHNGERFSTERGVTGWCHFYHYWRGLRHYYAGAWDDAVAETEAGQSFGEELGSRAGALAAHALLTLIAFHRDELAVAEKQFSLAEQELADIGPDAIGLAWLQLARLLIAGAHGDVAQACESVGHTWDALADTGCRMHYRMIGPEFVRHAVVIGDYDRAERVTQDLEALALEEPTPTAQGAALHCRGLVDSDEEKLHAAVKAYRDSPRPLPRASAYEDAAVLGSSRLGIAEARRLFETSLDDYRQIGAQRDAARVMARMRSLGIRAGARGPRRRTSSGWDSLTPTERRIVTLVATGLSNPEIGSRMYISRRTVQTHLSHIFPKLQVASRAELAAEAARRGAS